MFNVDAAVEQVKVQESFLYPTLSLNGSMQKSYGSTNSLTTLETLSGSVIGQLTVPIYQGGAEYANIRQAKETLGQRRIDLDTARLSVQQNVTQSWGQLEAAKAQIDSTTAQVTFQALPGTNTFTAWNAAGTKYKSATLTVTGSTTATITVS